MEASKCRSRSMDEGRSGSVVSRASKRVRTQKVDDDQREGTSTERTEQTIDQEEDFLPWELLPDSVWRTNVAPFLDIVFLIWDIWSRHVAISGSC